MKQLIQSLRNGETEIVDVPMPQVRRGHYLIRTTCSLISAGTEKMLIDFGRSGWLEKARQQPEKVKQVLNKVRTDGLMTTLNAVQSKLDTPIPVGYCNVGRVVDVGVGLGAPGTLRSGDRVISNGHHAEMVCIPANLCARIPDAVDDEAAAFTVLGAIALQGIRLLAPTIGETVAVTGLGLIGQLTVQILRANGCRVFGIDIDPEKCRMAETYGAIAVDVSQGENPIDVANELTTGCGLDGVLITAATDSNEPVHQAAVMCRKRGRIVLVGTTGLKLDRADFYEKELTFQVSCSYGPGRYDPVYEQQGHDYPFGFVRWTEQRNFNAILQLMADGKLDTSSLLTHRFDIDNASAAYDLISNQAEPYLGILINYPETGTVQQDPHSVPITVSTATGRKISKVVAGMIGAGGFTDQVLLPAIQKSGVRLKSIASQGGLSGTHLGRKFGFETSVTDNQRIFADTDINTVFISTRHDTHARLVIEALKAGKHVFVEKPLCIRCDELEEIETVFQQQHAKAVNGGPLLMVGYNRRFAPQVERAAQLLEAEQAPRSIAMLVNAGNIPAEHWTQDPHVGGGRIIGEVCHFIDLLRFLAGSRIREYQIVKLESGTRDTVGIQLHFQDGSIGSIQYFANGHKAVPKERLDIYCNGKIIQIENFRMMRGYGFTGFNKLKLGRQDKGHTAEIKAFVNAIRSGTTSPIAFDQVLETARVSIELAGMENVR